MWIWVQTCHCLTTNLQTFYLIWINILVCMHNVKMVLSHFILLYCKPTTVNIVAIYVQQQLKNNLFLFVLGKKRVFLYLIYLYLFQYHNLGERVHYYPSNYQYLHQKVVSRPITSIVQHWQVIILFFLNKARFTIPMLLFFILHKPS